ncbi:endo alpha-1,4 polygalactosaminidase [Magnetococcus sp. PR-3]|uniref:endo alpha-1,4 polygalactosaminidase n=1 Tax=Magnetococcus sp. PR-3 TaxID=3120355 RepID=UPI002FCE3D0A
MARFDTGMFKWIPLFVFSWLLYLSPLPSYASGLQYRIDSWAVYYANKASTQDFNDYELVVLDSTFHPPIPPLLEQDKTLLGYLSLGEVGQHRDYFAKVKEEDILLQENAYWKGSYFVDVRSPLWTKRVLETLIPDILQQGFQGIFIDTLDNPPYLEQQNPKQFKGMAQAAINLIHAIRLHYPDMLIMVNRGYAILPKIQSTIDMVLGEAVYTKFDFQDKRYVHVPNTIYNAQVNILKKAKKGAPHLQVFTLDYWDPKDKAGLASIAKEQKKNGFTPYIATHLLDQLVPQP